MSYELQRANALRDGAREENWPEEPVIPEGVFLVAVEEKRFRCVLAENERLQAQVTELQATMSRMVNDSLERQVAAFHQKFGHPVATTPKVPDDEQVRFRLNLIAEEFFEIFEAALKSRLVDTTGESWAASDLQEAKRRLLMTLIPPAAIQARGDTWFDVDLPEFVDAMGDLAFVIQGTACVFGVHMPPVMKAISEANQAKDAVYVSAKDGYHMGDKIKPTKPAGWRPPNIVEILVAQGWVKT